MRINEFNSLEEFTSQYVGVWYPRDEHYLGLDFSYRGEEYRLHTWSMYKDEMKVLPNGRDAVFGLYKKVSNDDDEQNPNGKRQYELLGKYADMHDLLESRVIGGVPFSEVIMDDYTELLGQD